MNWFYTTRRMPIYLFVMFLFAGLQAIAAPATFSPPNWSVNPDDFEFNMTAVVRVSFSGAPSNAAGNRIGAFVGNELRGVAEPVFFGTDAYFFLHIYSDQYTGETVHFKVYYAPNDAVYGAFEDLVFIHNLEVGTSEVPFLIDLDPNADFPPVLDYVLEDTTLQTIPFETVDLNPYLFSADADPVTWSAQPGPNLTASVVNGILVVTPVSPTWIGTDSVRIIVRENTPNQLADTLTGWFTVLEDYGAPVWLDIPDQSIFPGQQFTGFDLDDYLDYDGPCHQFDYKVYPFTGAAPDPAWPVVIPGTGFMNIIARPLFAAVQLAGAGSKLAAFVNGTLAGWATATGSAPNVTYSLQVKNVGAGAITFKFYDAQQQYLYTELSGLNFAAGGSAGSIASPYLLQLSPLIPALDANGAFTLTIDDPNWVGQYPVGFIVWDCDYPDIRRDTVQVIFSIISDIRPEITSPGSVSFEENACSVLYDAQTTDPNNSEGAGLTYSLDGGADVARFVVNAQTGVLSWAPGFTPDFENPQDADANNQYQVNIKVTNGSALSDVLALTVTVANQAIEPFTVKINTGETVICANGTVDLNATGGFSYLWSTGSSQPLIQVSAGTYTITATSTGACTATAAMVVASKPSISAAGNPGAVCIGSDILLSSAPMGGSAPYASFSWSGPNAYSALVEDPAGFPATAAAGGVYTVTLNDAAGCTVTANVNITVSGNAAPSIIAISNSPVCEASNLMLSSTPSGGTGAGYTFLWSGPNSFQSTAQNPAAFALSTAGAGTYTVTLTDNAGCRGTGSTTVQVNTKPLIVAGSNSPVSVGGTILLSSTTSGGSGGAYTYVWSGPNNYASTAAQPAGFVASLAAAGVYKVTVTDGNGCTGTSTTQVNVVTCPTISASVSGAVCEGGMITLQSTPNGGALPYASFSWAGPQNYQASVEDPAAFAAALAAAGTYTVTVTDHLGCTATATVSVAVNGNPSISAQNNGPMCAGGTAMVSSNPSGGTPGYSFAWTGPDFFGASVEDPASFTATSAASGVYQVKVTDSKGCTATAVTTLTVHPKPVITASSNSPLCEGANLDLSSNPSGGSGVYTFSWSGPANFVSALEDPSPFAVTTANAGTYTVTVTDNQGCSSTASTTLSVSGNNAPSITASSNSPICAGSQLMLSSMPSAGTPPYKSFSWTGPGNYSSNLEDPNPFAAFLIHAGVYTVTVTDNKNCKGTASVTVNIFAPALSPSTNSPVCPGATLQLNAGGPSGAGITYSWTGPNNFTSAQANPSIAAATAAASGTYTVTVNDNGCIGSSTVTASVSDVTPPSIACPANTTINADAACSSPLGAYAPISVSDNCTPNPTVSQSPAASTIISGHNLVQTVTLTANDGNGNTATCNFAVTLKDVSKPSITCPANTTVSADAGCNGLVGAYNAVSVSDNCNPNPTVSQSPAASTVLSGHNDVETLTLTASDGNGNTQFCTFTVTLKDVTKPSITCPANTTVAADAACSGVVGAYNPLSVSDNCNPNPTVSQSPAPATVLSGHNDVETVTLTADDGNGNTQICTFTVTLKDQIKPSITCPPSLNIAADGSCSSPVGAYTPVSLSDNCNPNPVVSQIPAATTVISGHNHVETITLTADDGNGNTQFCTFTVTLKDVTKPSITCPANTTVTADAACSGVVGAYNPLSVSDNCNPNPTVSQSPAPATVLSGHNDVETVTLTANDGNGNTQFCTFTVTLKDVTKPSITCPANTTVAADAACSGVVGAYSAVSVGDNCNPNPTVSQSPAPATILSGHNDVETVTLTANDGNGNTQFCTFTVTLKDVTKPSITCPANTTLAADANCSSLLGSFAPLAVSDNCNPNPAISQSPVASTLLSGHNDLETVTLTANDGNGNTQFCTFTVTLKDVTAPVVVCKPFTAALSAAGAASITTANVFQSGTDNCGVVNQVSVLPNAFTCSNLGPNIVVLTVNDGNGNTATCNATVTVVDLIPPTMVCKSKTVFLSSGGTASITTADLNNGSTDNCTLSTLSLSVSNFNCAQLGANLVTLTGTDQSGNTATCQTTVTVIDNLPPTMICKNATLNLNNTGQANLVFADVNNGSFDNCTITSFGLSQTLYTCVHLGANTVTLTGTDQSGNSASCTATVTVRDLILPVAKCKNATANLDANGNVILNPASIDNGTTDNCTFTLSTTPAAFTCANIGTQTVTLKATDSSGNTKTCNASVTVKDVTAPIAQCKNLTLFLDHTGHVPLTAAQVDNGSTDNCSIVSRSIVTTEYGCGELSFIQSNTLSVTDASGNVGTCIARITIKDNLVPTAVCQNVTVTLGANGFVSVQGMTLAVNSFDNCAITSYTPVSKTYTAANIGDNNLVITVKDWSGNAATCTSVVTVLPSGPSERPEGNLSDRMEPEQDADFNLELYPNPSQGLSVLAFELPEEQAFDLKLRDLTGRLVLEQSGIGTKGSNALLIQLHELKAGLYLLEFNAEPQFVIKRLVLQK